VKPFATLQSAPLHDVIRDVNKLSNNVMARQLFLTLSTTSGPPPATIEGAREAVHRWLAERKLAIPGFQVDNGSGLSRTERVTARGLAQLLAAAHASPVREELAGSLAIAAIDGTLERRMRNGSVAGRALFKTGSLEGVRALAGYLQGADETRWILVAMVNHPNAARAQGALDFLAHWSLRNAASYVPPRH
jgi:D-alanyl-D-alanine carboxypeptidase/D-alanyl-D-alanine-endopeptidase (penicillin-binding protein 4)